MPVKRLLLPLLIFAITLAIATFFMGDIGVYNDDYFTNQRDMVTGEAHDLVMNRPWHLWRPLTRVVLVPLVTILWPHPWALHVISAALHAVIVALVYTLLRRFRVRAAIAGPVALAFMVYPVHFETVLWIDIICTLLSVILVLSVWHGYRWWLEFSHERSGVFRFAALVGFGGLAYAAACFNEQPPGCLAALALAPLVLGLAAGATFRKQLVRSALPVVSVTLGLCIYLYGFFRHMPSAVRADHETQTVVGLPTRFSELAAKVPRELLLRDFGSGAFREGWHAIAASPLQAALAFGLLGALGLVWVFRRPARTPTTPAPTIDPITLDTKRALALAALGLTWMLFSWVPVAAAHSSTAPRLHYVPCIGIAIFISALLTILASRFDQAGAALQGAVLKGVRFAFTAAVAFALVMWIGIQANFQLRCATDRAEIAPLARVFAASIEPNTLVLPVHLDSRTAHTGAYRFDDYFQHCWVWNFAAGWNVQQALRNPHVHTVQTTWGVWTDGVWLSQDAPEQRGILRARIAPPRPPELNTLFPQSRDKQGRDLPWDRVVFFDIEGAGNTRIYTKLRLHIPGRTPVELVPRQVAISPLASALPEYVLDLYQIPENRRHAPIDTAPGKGPARRPR